MAERKFSFDTEPGEGTAGNANGADGNSAIPPGFIDPAALGTGTGNHTGTDTGPARRKRGRPVGSGSGSNQKASGSLPLNVNGVEKILISLHTIAAATLQTPELILEAKEANEVAQAMANVASLYDVGMSPKQAAWTNLAMVCGACYGPRALAIYVRKSMEEKPAPKAETPRAAAPAPRGTVVPFDTTKIEMPN